MENEEVTCTDEYCVESAPHEEHALWTGWRVIEGALYCPLHASPAALEVKRQAQTESINRRANEIEAKRSLDPAWYRAWDEFQADIANFHRRNGRPTHKNLRTMTPHAFKARYRQSGKIDVTSADETFTMAENAFKDKMSERYKSI